jgi:hypothetical protein
MRSWTGLCEYAPSAIFHMVCHTRVQIGSQPWVLAIGSKCVGHWLLKPFVRSVFPGRVGCGGAPEVHRSHLSAKQWT